jgi:hypothetical protein
MEYHLLLASDCLRFKGTLNSDTVEFRDVFSDEFFFFCSFDWLTDTTDAVSGFFSVLLFIFICVLVTCEGLFDKFLPRLFYFLERFGWFETSTLVCFGSWNVTIYPLILADRLDCWYVILRISSS